MSRTSRTTSARRSHRKITSRLARLKTLVHQATGLAWETGDLVNELKAVGVTVREQADLIGASRQRLSELRQTALAFPADKRPQGGDIHFYTVAMRSARRLNLEPAKVVDELIRKGIDSSRQATRYLAEKERRRVQRQKSRESKGAIGMAAGPWNRCHHAPFQVVLSWIAKHSIKMIIADPPYGKYARYPDGKQDQVGAAAKDCDNLEDAAARAQMADLFRLAAPRLTDDGCLVVFRPGGHGDPAWLMQIADEHGFECRHALAWRRGPVKLGDGRSPYTSGTERILVFAQRGATLINHDGSSPSDILEVKLPRKSLALADQHLFEKPVALMKALIGKHTYPGDQVVEPFGGTAPACRAAVEMGRKWVYAESNEKNFRLGSGLIMRSKKNLLKVSGSVETLTPHRPRA